MSSCVRCIIDSVPSDCWLRTGNEQVSHTLTPYDRKQQAAGSEWKLASSKQQAASSKQQVAAPGSSARCGLGSR